VETPAGTRTVSVGTPLRMATRTAGPDAGNLARCQPVESWPWPAEPGGLARGG